MVSIVVFGIYQRIIEASIESNYTSGRSFGTADICGHPRSLEASAARPGSGGGSSRTARLSLSCPFISDIIRVFLCSASRKKVGNPNIPAILLHFPPHLLGPVGNENTAATWAAHVYFPSVFPPITSVDIPTMPTKRSHKTVRRRCIRACTTCKRRKERCDGRQPCRRCVERGVDFDCRVSHPPLRETLSPTPEPNIRAYPHGAEGNQCVPQERNGPRHLRTTSAHIFPQSSRLAKDERGKYMFIGDAANLTFLQNVRRIAHVALGRCAFVDDPLRHHILETYDDGHERLIIESAINPPSKPTSEDANYLIHWYILATNCVLDAVDQHELFQGMSEWLLCSREEPCETSAIYYLVLALGAQSCPESRDSDAEKNFNFWSIYHFDDAYGRSQPSHDPISCACRNIPISRIA